MNRLSYYLSEGIRGIFLHGFSNFAAVGVIVACLIIMGSFSLVAVNIRAAMTQLEENNAVVVLLDRDLSEAEAKSIGSRISEFSNVRERIYMSREDVLASFREKLGDSTIAGIDADVFAPQYEVKLVDIALAAETAAALRNLSGVTSVQSPQREMDFLLSVRRIVDLVSVILIVLLFAVSLFIMSNTIKLATIDRKEEIGIMRIVGATKAFIRGPFVVEGFFLGLFSGALAYFLQWFSYAKLSGSIQGKIQVFQLVSFAELSVPMLLAFVLMGFVVGMGGSILAIRRFLNA